MYTKYNKIIREIVLRTGIVDFLGIGLKVGGTR